MTENRTDTNKTVKPDITSWSRTLAMKKVEKTTQQPQKKGKRNTKNKKKG